MQTVFLEGNLVKDMNIIPCKDEKTTGIVFRLACDGYSKKDTTLFIDVVAWGEVAKQCINADIKKGSKVSVVGTLKNRKNNRDEWVIETVAKAVVPIVKREDKEVTTDDQPTMNVDDIFR